MKISALLFVIIALSSCSRGKIFTLELGGPVENPSNPEWIELFQKKANEFCPGHAKIIKDSVVFTQHGMEGRVVCE